MQTLEILPDLKTLILGCTGNFDCTFEEPNCAMGNCFSCVQDDDCLNIPGSTHCLRANGIGTCRQGM